MIDHPTLFVMGAGASKPYGFPSAFGLLQEVFRSLQRVEDRKALSYIGFTDIDQMQSLMKDLTESGFNSVDEFLETRTEFLELGRAAIVLCIARLERDQNFFKDSDVPGGPSDDPYRHILRALWDPTSRTLSSGQAAFVTFNYDRSLEHYLASALRSRRSCTYAEALEDLAKIPIIHVYGSLGPLSPSSGGWDSFRPFGANWQEPGYNQLSAKSLRLIGEHRGEAANAPEPGSPRETASRLVASRNRIIFLGFGYDAANLARIRPATRTDEPQIFGTTAGLKLRERSDAINRLSTWGEYNPKLRGALRCSHVRLCEDGLLSEEYLRKNIRL